MKEISFWESFFGMNWSRQNRFINQFNRLMPYMNQIWGIKQPVWIDTQNAWEWFLSIPELRAIIDKRASMMCGNIPRLYDKNGIEVENHWFLDLVAKPNPMQSWADVVYSLSVNDALYSNVFAYCPERTGKIRNLIIPLPSNKMQVVLSGRVLKQMDREGMINGYKFEYDNDKIEALELNDVLYITTPDGMNIVNPTSRIDALKYPLSNIKASYHKRNVLLENIGAIGILSAQKSDLGGNIPMTPEERREIQKDWYNRSKDELIITESQVDWKPMSYPTKDLMLFEELTSDKLAIMDAYGMNSNLFSTEKGSTYTNVRDSIRMVYTDTIIPETQQMYNSMCHQFGLSDEGYTIVADFSHIPVLQEDEEKKATTLNTRADALTKIINANVPLSDDEKRALLGI